MDSKQFIPVIGMVAVLAVAAAQVSSLDAQGIPQGLDLTAATMVELHDGQGRAVLRGLFDDVVDDDGDRERHAALGPAGDDARVSGAVEIEMSRNEAGIMEQEIEVAVRNVAPRTQLTIVIDGVEVGVLTTDARGRGAFEIEKAS